MSFVCVRKKKCVFSEKRFRLILNDMETRNQTLKVVLNLNVLLWFTWKMKCHVKIQVDFGRPCDFLTQSIVLHKDLFRCALVPPVLLWYYSIIWQMRGESALGASFLKTSYCNNTKWVTWFPVPCMCWRRHYHSPDIQA